METAECECGEKLVAWTKGQLKANLTAHKSGAKHARAMLALWKKKKGR